MLPVLPQEGDRGQVERVEGAQLHRERLQRPLEHRARHLEHRDLR